MENELFILWTSDNPVTAEKMVFMYGHNALKKGWWEKVTIIIWGAATVLASENEHLRKKIREMTAAGVNFIACKACADSLKASKKLEEIGVQVFYTGETLTSILKDRKPLLTV